MVRLIFYGRVRLARVRLLRHALPISLLILRKKPTVLQSRLLLSPAIKWFILLNEKFLQFYWLRAVVFQHNLKYLHVKITTLL